MAQKRMFDKAIIDTDNFMDLSMSSKALYFLLGMEADDEGFTSPRRVMRVYGGNDDDLNVLILKKFVIPFKSGVVVITNWHENNYLDKNRIKPTKYIDERQSVVLTEAGTYVFNECLASVKPEERRIEENSVEESTVERVTAAKAAYGEFSKVKLTGDEYQKLIERMGEKNTQLLITELDTYIASKGKKYSSHYATLLNWARRKVSDMVDKKLAGKNKVAF